jgi:hypothetical protein
MGNSLEDGYYLVKPKEKGGLTYMGEKFIVHIYGAKEYPDDCVSLTGDESQYSLKSIKIIKKLDLNKL